ncbi:MAG: AmmeMemoRadiSam system protein A [Acidimicrobiales bacterium]|nr:AmmeMemoRadiSam system protein A [Acidimicrobiales bacterium]
MARLSSPEPAEQRWPPAGSLDAAEADGLFAVVESSIRFGLAGGDAPGVDLDGLPDALRRHQAVFVTLKVAGQLNGCIGTLDAKEPLAAAAARAAYDAAFADPRLPPLSPRDWPELCIGLSLLSELEPIPAGSPGELLSGLRPEVDGLLLATGWRRATFLPAMWEQLPDPLEFLRHLLAKGGIPERPWPVDLRGWRYTAVELARPATPPPSAGAGPGG